MTAMATWQDRLNLVVFEPLKLEQPWTLANYRSIGGYGIWQQIPQQGPFLDVLRI